MHYKHLAPAAEDDGRYAGMDLWIPPRAPRNGDLRHEAIRSHRFRFRIGSEALLYCAIDSSYDFAAFLYGESWTSLVPPIHAPKIRSMPSPEDEAAWWRAWTRELVKVGADEGARPLGTGFWRVVPSYVLPEIRAYYGGAPWSKLPSWPPTEPRITERSFVRQELREEDWCLDEARPGEVLGLRLASTEDTARVKAWRKRARDWTMPPVLLMWHGVLQRHLVLDGHDRMLAAHLEGLTPPLLCAVPLWWAEGKDEATQRAVMEAAASILAGPLGEEPQTVLKLNKVLLQAFGAPPKQLITRARPYRGGTEAWRRNVKARLAQLQELDPWIVQILLE